MKFQLDLVYFLNINHLYLRIYNKKDGNKIFGVSSRFDLYIVQNKENTKPTEIIDELGKKHLIKEIIKQEEKGFLRTLGKGLELINHLINKLDNNVVELEASYVFQLYDTYGFPADLTSLILQEKGLSYNVNEFNNLMLQQQNSAA